VVSVQDALNSVKMVVNFKLKYLNYFTVYMCVITVCAFLREEQGHIEK